MKLKTQIVVNINYFIFAKSVKYMHLTLYINFSIGVNWEPPDQLEKDFANCVGFSLLSDRDNLKQHINVSNI